MLWLTLSCHLTDLGSSAHRLGLRRGLHKTDPNGKHLKYLHQGTLCVPSLLEQPLICMLQSKQGSLFQVGMDGMNDLDKLTDVKQIKERQQTKAVADRWQWFNSPLYWSCFSKCGDPLSAVPGKIRFFQSIDSGGVAPVLCSLILLLHLSTGLRGSPQISVISH